MSACPMRCGAGSADRHLRLGERHLRLGLTERGGRRVDFLLGRRQFREAALALIIGLGLG